MAVSRVGNAGTEAVVDNSGQAVQYRQRSHQI
jgi:hypothetical protein